MTPSNPRATVVIVLINLRVETKIMTNHSRIINALNSELQNLYHNARMNYPCNECDECEKLGFNTYEYLSECASFEIQHLNDYASCGNIPYGNYEHNKDLHPYAKRMKNREYYRDLRHNPESQISDCGNLYTWGRMGATLAPNNLINARGGSRFSIKQFDLDDLNAESATDMLRIVSAFNSYVGSWCSEENLSYMLKEGLKEKAQSLRDSLKALIKEAKAATLTPAICEAVKDKIKSELYQLNSVRTKLA